MSESFFAGQGGFNQPDPVGPQQPAKRAVWLWVVVGVIITGVVVASVIAGITSPGTQRGNRAAASSESAGVAGQPDAAGSVNPSSSPTGVPDNPGEYGKPSMPSSDPADPWRGTRPIGGFDDAAFVDAMMKKWSLDYRIRPVNGGSMRIGLAGDLSRKQRRLDAITRLGLGGQAYVVMCQAGGTEIAATDETVLKFVPDCLSEAVHGQEWEQIRTWLDQNLRQYATNGGSTWYRLPAVQLYVESDGHILSASLVSFT